MGSLLQKMKEQDEKPDLVDRLAKDEPSNALKIAIRQTTQQWNGNKKVLIPLKEHIEVLARFDRKGAEWKKIPGGFDFRKLSIGMWEFDDKALLDFGERILEDLRQGKHRNADIQTPWGDTYNDMPSIEQYMFGLEHADAVIMDSGVLGQVGM
ncbi:hypothetical protein SLS63_001156 [Diaporthe eres]|uniref:Uncharacterized protein n=1 Tax=Diaporthe eres TaxID=83184 RepID=A0ABR1PP94_DIAER